MKQTVQNLQYCLHCFEISWAGFQPEGVLGQVSKTEYLLKSVFLFSLPWGREGCSEQSQLFSWLRIFPLLGSSAENALRERALLSVKMYAKVLQKADGNTAGAELCLGFPGRSLFLGRWCRQEKGSGSRQAWRSWDASLVLLLCLTVLQPPQHKSLSEVVQLSPLSQQHLPRQRASTWVMGHPRRYDKLTHPPVRQHNQGISLYLPASPQDFSSPFSLSFPHRGTSVQVEARNWRMSGMVLHEFNYPK